MHPYDSVPFSRPAIVKLISYDNMKDTDGHTLETLYGLHKTDDPAQHSMIHTAFGGN